VALVKAATLVEDGRFASTLSRESEWIRRLRAGDASAFDEIYRTFARMVFGLAVRLVGDREEAADLAQEVFVRVHRGLRRFRAGSSLRTWIYRITLNRCRSHLRRRRPLLLRWFAGGAEEDGCGGHGDRAALLIDPQPGPDERVAAHDVARRVEAALRRLPAVYREAVVLRDLQELSYEEIATVLRLPLGTVRSRIARGRDRLRAILEEGA
jgi:RNA polymerase sigma-70 factor (ECF subfamily)